MKMDFLKKKNNFKRKDFSIDVALYWELIVILGFFLILTTSIGSFILFREINQEPAGPVSGIDTKVPSVNKDELTKVLNYFQMRAERSQQILNSPTPVVDPTS
jgi:hypothetical protein